MMISFIISHSPVFGVLLIIVFIIAAIIDGFRKLGRKLDAYNEKYGKQEEEMCHKEKEEDEIIEISNPWSENKMHFAIASYDKKTKMYQAYVFHGRDSTIRLIVSRSKDALEKEIDETYKKFNAQNS